MKNNYDISELIPLIKESIDNDKEVAFNPKGISMLPTFNNGNDTIYLVKANNLKKFDIILYINNNNYIIHRIIKINKDNTYITLGDNNTYLERNISKENIIAKVIRYRHNNKEITTSNKKFYTIGFFRLLNYPFRKIIRRIKGHFKKS